MSSSASESPATASDGSAPPAPPGRLDEISFSMDFLPVFDRRDGCVNTLYCRPTACLVDGRRLDDEDLLAIGMTGRTVNEAAVTKVMVRTLEMASVRANLMASTGDDRKILVPVNGAALSRRSIAGVFTEACRTFTREHTERLLFEATNMDDEKSQAFLDEVAILLYPFCLTYSARALPRTQNFKLYATTNFAGIALHLRDKPWPMKALGTYFADLVDRAEKSRLKAYCHGLGTPELVDAALAAGVRFVSGAGVKEWLERRG